MNKTLIAVGTGALFLGTGVVSAGEAAKVYGRADVSYQYESYKYGADQDGNTFVLKSNASRFGVKGKKTLDNDLTAIYQLEWEVDFTDKDAKNGDGDNILKARNSFIGLTGEFGTVVAGTHDTPLKKAQGEVDLFGDLEADIKHVVEGEVRTNNVLQYSTPKIADSVVANIAIVPGEGTEDGANDVDNGVADAISASVVYSTDEVFAAFAMDDSVGGFDNIRLTGQIKVQDAKIGLIYQISEPSDGPGDDEDGIILSASYKLGKETLKFQYGVSDMKDAGLEQVSVGIDHKLEKKTNLYAFLTSTTTDVDADEELILAAGIQHKF